MTAAVADSGRRRDSAALAAMALIALILPSICAGEAPGAWRSRTPPDFAWRWTVQPASSLAPLQNAEVRTRELQIGIGVASLTAGELDVGIGLDYQYTRYEYENIAGRNRDLHRLQIPVHFLREGASWTLEGYLAPGLATSSNVMKDLIEHATSDDFLLTGRLTARRRIDSATSWFTGLAFDRAFGQPTLYPVAGIEYAPADRFILRIAFPDPAVQLTLTDRQSLLLRAFPAGQRWHVVTDDFADDFDYTLRAVRAELNWSLQFGPRLRVDLGTGLEFARHHDFIADDRLHIDADVENGIVISVGLRWGGAPLPGTHGTHL